MISPVVVAEIQRLLRERRYSHRMIGAMVGVSRNTVGAVASGRHRNIGASLRPAENDIPVGPPKRCPTCGGMVYMPCLLCRVRNNANLNPLPRRDDRATPDESALAALQLRPEHQKRYLRVRARRMRLLAAGYP